MVFRLGNSFANLSTERRSSILRNIVSRTTRSSAAYFSIIRISAKPSLERDSPSSEPKASILRNTKMLSNRHEVQKRVFGTSRGRARYSRWKKSTLRLSRMAS